MFLRASLIITTPVTISTAKNANTTYVGTCEADPVEKICPIDEGTPAIIPAKISKEIPFPIPFSDIISPSHIKNTAPAVTVTNTVIRARGANGSKIPWRVNSVISAYP